MMPEPSSRQVSLCGVRLQRGGQVLFADADGHDVAPRQVVVVDVAGREALAMVVFGPEQLVSIEPRVGPAGRVLRLATHEESLGFVRAVPDNGVEAAGLPDAWAEWLVEPGEEPVVQTALDEGEPTAAELIERLFPPH